MKRNFIICPINCSSITILVCVVWGLVILLYIFSFFYCSLNNNKANSNHTHGVAKQTSTIASNTFLTQLGNLAIFSWWTGNINISSANTWTDIWTLPVTNKGKCVWSSNIYNGVDVCYFRINENSNKVQALSNKTGNTPFQSGELVFFIE